MDYKVHPPWAMPSGSQTLQSMMHYLPCNIYHILACLEKNHQEPALRNCTVEGVPHDCYHMYTWYVHMHELIIIDCKSQKAKEKTVVFCETLPVFSAVIA